MKEIKLSQGLVALVDDEDYDFISQWKWCVMKCKHNFYAVRSTPRNGLGKQKNIRMHRVLLNINNPEIFVDHKDRNGLNNQRNNLRIATYSQNSINRRINNNSISKYVGVAWAKRGKWQASIGFNNKNYFIGYFDLEVDAAAAYNKKAKELFGEFANLNIIK